MVLDISIASIFAALIPHQLRSRVCRLYRRKLWGSAARVARRRVPGKGIGLRPNPLGRDTTSDRRVPVASLVPFPRPKTLAQATDGERATTRPQRGSPQERPPTLPRPRRRIDILFQPPSHSRVSGRREIGWPTERSEFPNEHFTGAGVSELRVASVAQLIVRRPYPRYARCIAR